MKVRYLEAYVHEGPFCLPHPTNFALLVVTLRSKIGSFNSAFNFELKHAAENSFEPIGYSMALSALRLVTENQNHSA